MSFSDTNILYFGWLFERQICHEKNQRDLGQGTPPGNLWNSCGSQLCPWPWPINSFYTLIFFLCQTKYSLSYQDEWRACSPPAKLEFCEVLSLKNFQCQISLCPNKLKLSHLHIKITCKMLQLPYHWRKVKITMTQIKECI